LPHRYAALKKKTADLVDHSCTIADEARPNDGVPGDLVDCRFLLEHSVSRDAARLRRLRKHPESRSCGLAGTVWHKRAVPALRHGRAHLAREPHSASPCQLRLGARPVHPILGYSPMSVSISAMGSTADMARFGMRVPRKAVRDCSVASTSPFLASAIVRRCLRHFLFEARQLTLTSREGCRRHSVHYRRDILDSHRRACPPVRFMVIIVVGQPPQF
jgi:hypothetical protein